MAKSGFCEFAEEDDLQKKPLKRGFLSSNKMEATTRIELVIAILQTAALATWLRRLIGAGDGIRTRDIQLGKLTLYH